MGLTPEIRSAVDGIIRVTVSDIDNAIGTYTKIEVYQDTESDGSFSTLTGSASLVADTTGYNVFDADGDSTLYYRARLSDADGSTTSGYSTVRAYGYQAAYCDAFDVRAQLATGSGSSAISAKWEHQLWEMCITASRLIDEYKGVEDEAYLASGSETRYFDGTGDDQLWIDPAISISTVEVEETDGTWTTWQSTDYRTWPYNETPILLLEVSDRTESDKSAWTSGPKRVRLTGVWGVSTTVPAQVRQACAVQVAIWYKRAMAGWATREGSPEFGFITYPRTLDADVMALLDHVPPYRSFL